MTSSFRAFRTAFRFGTAALRTSAVLRNRRAAVVGGVSTSLAVSFWSSAKPAESDDRLKGIPNYARVIEDSDLMYNMYLIDNAYNILKKYSSTENSELLWRLARVLCEKGKLSKDPNEKKQLMYEAFSVVEKALKHEPEEGCFGAHKWYAILLDYIGEIEGSKARIANSNTVKKHLERALEIDGKDATTWHILGVWHFSFADMSTLTRMAAQTIYGMVPNSTYEQALHYFMMAEKMDPDFYSANLFYIAEVYSRLGKTAEALEYYKKCFMMRMVTADDLTYHNKAYINLKKAGVKDEELSTSYRV